MHRSISARRFLKRILPRYYIDLPLIKNGDFVQERSNITLTPLIEADTGDISIRYRGSVYGNITVTAGKPVELSLVCSEDAQGILFENLSINTIGSCESGLYLEDMPQMLDCIMLRAKDETKTFTCKFILKFTFYAPNVDLGFGRFLIH